MSDTPRVEVSYATQEELLSAFNDNWKHGRAFVFDPPECPVPCDCDLVILHPLSGDEFCLAARAVALVPDGERVGLGLEFLEWDDGLAQALEIFVNEVEATDPGQEEQNVSKAAQLAELPVAQQVKLARNANHEERVLLERRLGKTVWEALLRNPKITMPEVAAMARKGTMPRPLLELIIENPSWMRSAPVQRALLANPRLSWEQVQKVLRSLPKPDLQQVAKNTAYPPSVRDAARKLNIGS